MDAVPPSGTAVEGVEGEPGSGSRLGKFFKRKVAAAIGRWLRLGDPSTETELQRNEHATPDEINTATPLRSSIEDDISAVIALLGKNWDTTAAGHDTAPLDVLQAVLRGKGDSVSDSYIQELVEAISRLALESAPADSRSSTASAPLRTLLQLVEQTGKLPSKIIQYHTECPDRRTYGTPKAISVYCGTLGDTKVALKHLRVLVTAKPSERPGLEKTFFREAVLWFSLSHHEHILPFLGLANVPEPNSMVFPWMENGNARQYLDRCVEEKGLSGLGYIKIVDKLLHEASLGLNFLHSNGVVHGELRGAHVYIDEKEQARLADYGLTPITDSGNDLSMSLPAGHAAWLAPELIEPGHPGIESSKSTLKTDVFAFGILCVELYTRQSPFQGVSDYAINTKILGGERPARPKVSGQDMEDALWSIVTRCWMEGPNERPSAAQIVDAFDDLIRVPESD